MVSREHPDISRTRTSLIQNRALCRKHECRLGVLRPSVPPRFLANPRTTLTLHSYSDPLDDVIGQFPTPRVRPILVALPPPPMMEVPAKSLVSPAPAPQTDYDDDAFDLGPIPDEPDHIRA